MTSTGKTWLFVVLALVIGLAVGTLVLGPAIGATRIGSTLYFKEGGINTGNPNQ